MSKRSQRFVNAMLAHKRPPRFEATDDEVREMQTAAQLHSGNVSASAPRPEFLAELANRLRAEESTTASRWGRRRFLQAGGAAAAGLVAGVAVDHALTGGQGNGNGGELIPQGATWTAVARVADVPHGSAKRFTVGAVEGFVVNNGGQFTAVSAVCTHLGCILNTGPDGLVCPCHGATFALSGKSTGWYVNPPLPTIRARVSGDTVEVLA